jgi:ParB family chromosome partitioning protein
MTRPGERGLGRGLGALIPRATAGGDAGLQDVPVDRVLPNPRQPRTRLDPTELEELAQSIREHGLLQPVVVSRRADGTYQLIAGERRWRAAQLAGLPTVPAVVKEATPQASLEMALVENIQRRDLNPLEEASAYKHLLEEHGLTQEALAHRVGKSRVAVTNTLRLLQLPGPVQHALAEGAITEGHARAMLAAETEAARLALLDRVVAEGLSVRQTEALARQPPPEEDEPAPRSPLPPDPDVAHLEDAFRQALGTKVQLIRGRRGGRLVIHFFSDDELQGLFEAIVRE